MENIWSKNNIFEFTINFLIYLLSMYFLRYGQLILPIICLLIFIENKCRFKVNSRNVFAILCLFAVTFLIFSYRLGIYSTIGFFLPMAYYVGSNIKDANEDKVKKLVYIITFGMMTHIILNYCYDFLVYGFSLFRKNKHYDIWTGDIVQSTGTATNMLYSLSFVYYYFSYENNKKYKIIGYILFIIAITYNIGLGRRTPVFVMLLTFFVSLLLDTFVFKNNKISIRKMAPAFIAIVIISLLLIICYIKNILDIKTYIGHITLFQKFMIDGIDPKRFDIFVDSLKYIPKHLWGGKEISELLSVEIHDLWMDTYDYAGIIPFILLFIYYVESIKKAICIFVNKKVSNGFKILLIEFYISTFMLYFLEPVMTGSSIFLLCSIILITAFETLIN